MILNKYFLKISSSAKHQKSPPPNTANKRFVINMKSCRLHGFRRWNIRNLAVAKLLTKTKEIRYRH